MVPVAPELDRRADSSPAEKSPARMGVVPGFVLLGSFVFIVLIVGAEFISALIGQSAQSAETAGGAPWRISPELYRVATLLFLVAAALFALANIRNAIVSLAAITIMGLAIIALGLSGLYSGIGGYAADVLVADAGGGARSGGSSDDSEAKQSAEKTLEEGYEGADPFDDFTDGVVTFRLETDEAKRYVRFSVPRGATYKFEASGGELDLAMALYRVETVTSPEEAAEHRDHSTQTSEGRIAIDRLGAVDDSDTRDPKIWAYLPKGEYFWEILLAVPPEGEGARLTDLRFTGREGGAAPLGPNTPVYEADVDPQYREVWYELKLPADEDAGEKCAVLFAEGVDPFDPLMGIFSGSERSLYAEDDYRADSLDAGLAIRISEIRAGVPADEALFVNVHSAAGQRRGQFDISYETKPASDGDCQIHLSRVAGRPSAGGGRIANITAGAAPDRPVLVSQSTAPMKPKQPMDAFINPIAQNSGESPQE